MTAAEFAQAIDETSFHGQVVEYLRLILPKGAVLHHSPNEGLRGPKAQRDLRASGCQAGFPDLAIFHAGRSYFIELKSATGKVSADQTVTHELLRRQGFSVVTIRNFDELRSTLAQWGFLIVAGGKQ